MPEKMPLSRMDDWSDLYKAASSIAAPHSKESCCSHQCGNEEAHGC